MTAPRPLGAVLAGGRARRFGGPKPLARVGGERLLDRVVRALRAAADPVVVVAGDPALAAAVTLPVRPDRIPDRGALGGIDTAVRWAREVGAAGVLVAACDLPFLAGPLLAALVREGRDAPGADVVVPESPGPLGVEPLCGLYAPSCLPAVEEALAGEDRSVEALLGSLRVHRLPLREVARYGDPAVLFLNVNTPADLARAERLARGGGV